MTSDPPERKCRVCGCTQYNACMTDEGTCHWISDDLCSECEDGRDIPHKNGSGGLILDSDGKVVDEYCNHIETYYECVYNVTRCRSCDAVLEYLDGDYE